MPVSSDDPNQNPVSPGPISHAEAMELIQNYKKTRPDSDDTESVWFSADQIKALIDHNNANGVRIHYGRYATDHSVYPGRHNVVLVPTFDAVTPHSPTPKNSKSLLQQDKVVVPGDGSFEGLCLDHGDLCPPRCTEQDPPPPPPGG